VLLPVWIPVVPVPLRRNAIAVSVTRRAVVVAVKLIGNAIAITVSHGSPAIVFPVVGIRDAISVAITHSPTPSWWRVSDLHIDLSLGGRDAAEASAAARQQGCEDYWSVHMSIS